LKKTSSFLAGGFILFPLPLGRARGGVGNEPQAGNEHIPAARNPRFSEPRDPEGRRFFVTAKLLVVIYKSTSTRQNFVSRKYQWKPDQN
jgi:hypothetical protein